MYYPLSKLPNVGLTIFTEMSQLALQENAINLGQGFPDYPMDKELIGLVNQAMLDGNNQYAHSNGIPLIRQKLAQKVADLYHSNIDPDTQITITPGGTYAIYTALTSFLQKDDEVILFEPAYDCYVPIIELNGAKPVYIQLQAPHYTIDWQEVKSKITTRTKAIIINSPQNPTGSVLSKQDIQELIAVTDGTDIIVISDEVYEHLIFDDLQHESILKYPELLQRGFACFSFGKTYNCTGWKLGYAISAPALMVEFRKVHQFNCFSSFTPTQVALAQFLDNKAAYLELGKKMQAKRDFLQSALINAPFKPLTSHGSYFHCYEYYGDLKETGIDLAKKITAQYKVATIPVSAFYHDGGTPNQILRFCFCKQDATLKEAGKRLSV